MKRVLIKISGEYLGKETESSPFSIKAAVEIAENIKELLEEGVEVALVIGGGNVVRGSEIVGDKVDRCRADQMGILATIMNGLFLHTVFQKSGLPIRLYSALPIPGLCDSFSDAAAIADLEKGSVVLCVGGSGNPYFTTDTAAVLRALELKCDVVLKATKVDGVYDSDPKRNKDAKRFEEISYKEVLEKELRVMDLASISLASDNKLPVIVFSLMEKSCFKQALFSKIKKTVIS